MTVWEIIMMGMLLRYLKSMPRWRRSTFKVGGSAVLSLPKSSDTNLRVRVEGGRQGGWMEGGRAGGREAGWRWEGGREGEWVGG